MTGKLFIIATPLGNLRDITLRALETLKSVDLIACEDTRRSLKLLNTYDISKPLVSCHEHNEAKRIPILIQKLKEGQSIALICDAGTPLISDPGYRLVRAVLTEEITLEALPGPAAVLNALVLSGLPTDQFYFIGFLPPKTAARKRALEALIQHPSTLIFYESPYRIQNFLKDAWAVLGPRQVSIAREMTKQHEEILRGQLGEVGMTKLPRSWKGEFVVVIEGQGKRAKK